MGEVTTVLRFRGALEGEVLQDYEFEITFFSIEDNTDYGEDEPVPEYAITFETVLGAKLSIPLTWVEDLTITKEHVLENPLK